MSIEEVAERLWGGEKYVLGPMIRACSLPLRLACLEYGADTVYSEEIPDYRAITCRRYDNKVLNCVDFLRGKGSDIEVLFRTHIEHEKDKKCCVLQLGTGDGVSALKAASVFERAVAGIDINMGCPKHYATSKGMGSELMNKPEIVEDILKTLKRNLTIPVSVKTRIFAKTDSSCNSTINSSSSCDSDIDINATLEWVRRLQSCSVNAIAIHGRTPKERNNSDVHSSVFPIIRDTLYDTSTHFIYNGDIWDRDDVIRLKTVDNINRSSSGGCYMLCRSALWDPSVFSRLRTGSSSDKSISLMELLSKIVTLSSTTANCPLNTRYLMQQIIAGKKQLTGSIRQNILKVFDLQGLSCDAIANCEEVVMSEKLKQQNTIQQLQVINDDEINDINLVIAEAASSDFLLNEQRKALKQKQKIGKLLKVSNCNSWPGIVSVMSHEYNDSYFDENYYISFKRCVPEHKKRPFAYSQFSTTTTTTTTTTAVRARIEKPINTVAEC